MERVFTKDIQKSNGDIRYRAGEIHDYPPPTWRMIADSIGESLSEFTVLAENLPRTMKTMVEDAKSDLMVEKDIPHEAEKSGIARRRLKDK